MEKTGQQKNNFQDFGIIEKILDEARFAPSGDNLQPWRFEKISPLHFAVHGFRSEGETLDRNGLMSALAIGGLLESISIAASRYGFAVKSVFCKNTDEFALYDIFLSKKDINIDPLAQYLTRRYTHRRILNRHCLSIEEKMFLERSVSGQLDVHWIEGKNRDNFARFLFRAGKLRLILPEMQKFYLKIIEKGARVSIDRIPDKALGLDLFLVRIIHLLLKYPRVMNFLNAYFAGTLLVRFEVDFLTGYFTGAHFFITVSSKPKTVEDYAQIGRMIQRFWLSATKLGFFIQPEMAALIFSKDINEGKLFTTHKGADSLAKEIRGKLEHFLDIEKTVFVGRIGKGKDINTRSLRKPLDDLWYKT